MASPLPSPTVAGIVYESYLHKTPPLDKLFVSWKKRWFVLHRPSMLSPHVLELCYYSDDSKREKKGVIDLHKFQGLRPNAKIGNKEHIFAIETEDRKYIFRAPSHTIKSIWVAKLWEFFGQEPVFHVTIPNQPSAVYNEGILKLTTHSHVLVVSPSTGAPCIELPFSEIRRLGCRMDLGADIVWFETCKNSNPDSFYFFSVASGVEAAHQITHDLKAAIERSTGKFLILEDSDNRDLQLSFISRSHYGCPEYPPSSRARVLQVGMRQLGSAAYMGRDGGASLSGSFGSGATFNGGQISLNSSVPSSSNSRGISLKDWAMKHRSIDQGGGPSLRYLRGSSNSAGVQLGGGRRDSTASSQGSDSGVVLDLSNLPHHHAVNSPRRLSQQGSHSSQGSSTYTDEGVDLSQTWSHVSRSGGAPVVAPRPLHSLCSPPRFNSLERAVKRTS